MFDFNYYEELQNDEWVDVEWDEDCAYGKIEEDDGRLIQGVSSISGDTLMTQKESWEKSNKPLSWIVLGGGGYAHCRVPSRTQEHILGEATLIKAETATAIFDWEGTTNTKGEIMNIQVKRNGEQLKVERFKLNPDNGESLTIKQDAIGNLEIVAGNIDKKMVIAPTAANSFDIVFINIGD